MMSFLCTFVFVLKRACVFDHCWCFAFFVTWFCARILKCFYFFFLIVHCRRLPILYPEKEIPNFEFIKSKKIKRKECDMLIKQIEDTAQNESGQPVGFGV